MSVEAAIAKLLENHPKGFDLSLDRIANLLAKLGNPHNTIPPVFHVAGTNGKGSVTAFLRAILEAANKTVHVHTSPHLVNWNERYRIGSEDGGKLVDDQQLEQAINRATNANGGEAITVFEIMSAVGFLLFSENPAEFTVMEVGLGGRFDATNMVTAPAVSIITPVSLDHQAYLGDTIDKIAFEKAGIIKPGRPVVVGPQEEGALEVIQKLADKQEAPATIARQDFDWYQQNGRLIYQDQRGLLDLPLPNLKGDHQLDNAAIAIAAIRTQLPELENEIFENAMTSVSWPGRFQPLPHGRLTEYCASETKLAEPEIWVDGGHNPQAGQMLARELTKLDQYLSLPTFLIVGMLTTKEPQGYFEPLTAISEKVITVPVPDNEAGFEPDKLAQIARKCGATASPATSIKQALSMVLSEADNKPCRVLICGSLYLVGETLRQNQTPPQ